MTRIRRNNDFYPARIILLLCVALLISFLSRSQDVYPDTANVEVADTVADSMAQETPNYFDYKTYGHGPDTIELRHVPPNVVDSLKNDDAFWYANAKLKKHKEESRPSGGTPRWLKILVWALVVGAFVAALIWYLVSSNIVLFAKAQRPLRSEKEEEEMAENIFSINYPKEIDKAVVAENYRLAIRLMFLRLLRNLSNRRIIHYRPERTNLEYLSQLFSTAYYSDFFRITRNYEYAWYGKFEVSADNFISIKNDFENFERMVK